MHHFFFSRKQKQYAAGLLTAMLLLEHTLLSPFIVQAAVPSVHGDSEVSAEASFPSAFLSGENVSFVSFPSRLKTRFRMAAASSITFSPWTVLPICRFLWNLTAMPAATARSFWTVPSAG